MELQILDAIQTLRTPVLDEIMPFITSLGYYGIIWILLTVLLLVFKKTRRAGCILALALVIEMTLCNAVLKPLIARVRPCDVNTAISLLIQRPKDYSFPSGHTAAAFTAASALYFAGEKMMGIASLVMGILLAFSRMYLYVHYPTDVLGGMVLGVICGYLGFLILAKTGFLKRLRATNTIDET